MLKKDITHLKSKKEVDLVEKNLTFQLIRNLNATTPISAFYYFRIRKYSLSDHTNDLPLIN